MGESMQSVRLRGISYNADFRYNERSLFGEFTKGSNYPGPLRKNEAYLFVSKNHDQILWIVGADQIGGTAEHPIIVLNSRRWRIQGGTWNPKMLANYAQYVGISLLGITKFEVAFEESQRRRKATTEDRHDTIVVVDNQVVKDATSVAAPKKPKKKGRAGVPGRLRVRGRPRGAVRRPTLVAAQTS